MEVEYKSYTATNELSPAGDEDSFLVFDEDLVLVTRFRLFGDETPTEALEALVQALTVTDGDIDDHFDLATR